MNRTHTNGELRKEDAGKYAAILAEGMAHDYGRNG